MHFQHFIAIDYSGAGDPGKSNSSLAVWEAKLGEFNPRPVLLPQQGQRTNWSRLAVHDCLHKQLESSKELSLIGMDHCFSWPARALDEHEFKTWDPFLKYMDSKWGHARERTITKEEVKESFKKWVVKDDDRHDLRLTDKFSSSAKSMFDFNGPGVALSSLAGLPWLAKLRTEFKGRVHFWPFDGWQPPPGKHCLVEIYPSLFSRRYPPPGDNESAHARDAAASCRWMQEAQNHGWLSRFFEPCLTNEQRSQALREGWILGLL